MTGSRNLAEERSKQIWVFRFWAILSVCCAHMPMNVQAGTVGFYLDRVRGMYGMLGVGGFFICSGYFFSTKRARTLAYWKNRIRNLVAPWLLLGAMTRIWTNYTGGIRPVIKGYLPWIMGKGTWMYFVPVLLELTVIFTICKRKWIIYAISVLSLCSNLAVIMGHGYGYFLTPYMNPLNWAVFFVLGMCWKEKEDLLQVYSQEIFRIAVIVFFITMTVQFSLNMPSYYWTWLSIPFEISGAILLFDISFAMRNFRLLRNIGKNTMFIFMTHMIMCGVTINHVSSEGILSFFHPVITLMITYAGAWILRKLLMICRLEWMNPVLGIGGE